MKIITIPLRRVPLTILIALALLFLPVHRTKAIGLIESIATFAVAGAGVVLVIITIQKYKKATQTTTTAPFTIPALNQAVIVQVVNTAPFDNNESVVVGGKAHFAIGNIMGANTLSLTFTPKTGDLLSGAIIPANSTISGVVTLSSSGGNSVYQYNVVDPAVNPFNEPWDHVYFDTGGWYYIETCEEWNTAPGYPSPVWVWINGRYFPNGLASMPTQTQTLSRAQIQNVSGGPTNSFVLTYGLTYKQPWIGKGTNIPPQFQQPFGVVSATTTSLVQNIGGMVINFNAGTGTNDFDDYQLHFALNSTNNVSSLTNLDGDVFTLTTASSNQIMASSASANVVIERSPDLQNWTPIITTVLPLYATKSITDSVALPNAFYRAKILATQ